MNETRISGLGRRPLAVAVASILRAAKATSPQRLPADNPLSHKSGAPLLFERLEPRVLLSADLFPNAIQTNLPLSVIPAVHYTLPLEIRNAGPDIVLQSSTVSVHASVDGVLDAQDVLLGTAILDGPLAANTNKTIAVDLDGARLVQPGTYTLITTVDANNAIAESNENNNQLVASNALSFALAFGNVPDQGNQNHPLTVTDADGSTATFTLQGAGYGVLKPLVGGYALNLLGTDASTSVQSASSAATAR
jgi:CARDB